MVVSKKCKICSTLDTGNIPILSEYFGKQIPDIISKMCNVEIDPRKTNGVLICQLCIAQLVYVDGFIEKVSNAVQRLKKNVKEVKPKTLPKDVKKALDQNQTVTDDGEKINESHCSVTKESNTVIEKKLDNPKRIVRRKSVYPDEKITDKKNEAIPDKLAISKETAGTESGINVKTPEKVVKGKNLNSEEKIIFEENDQIGNTSIHSNNTKKIKKVPDDATSVKSILTNAEKHELTPSTTEKNNNVGLSVGSNSTRKLKKIPDEVTPSKTTPTNGVKRKLTQPSIEMNNNASEESNGDQRVGPNTMRKLKKIPDDTTPVKSMPTNAVKCKLTPLTFEMDNNNFEEEDHVVQNGKKRNREMSESVGENSTLIDQVGNITNINETEEKVLNCILCGKLFHSKRTLRDHIETEHMGERLKACPHCSSEFRSKQKYESHVFSEKCKSNNHVCQFINCNKRFKTLHKMELHIQNKHVSESESVYEKMIDI